VIVRIASGLAALLFAFAAAVQYNDPDPLPWMAIYGAATISSALAAARLSFTPGAAATGLVALAWAGWLAPRVVGHTSFADLFGHLGMVDVHAEEGREMIGLLLVAGWMAALVLARLRRFAGQT
jgi:hypothetical protein